MTDFSETLNPEEERIVVEQQQQQQEAPWWAYDQLPSGFPYDWGDVARSDSEWDNVDFHLDLGCGALRKARLGIDRFWSPGVGLLMDLESLTWVPVPEDMGDTAKMIAKRSYELCKETSGHLPFPDGSIESIISHHAFEHIGPGFLHLMDECHRVLKSDGLLRIIVPLFPSTSAVADPDHKRYFMEDTWETFCGAEDGSHWMESFSVPYTNCRFEKLDIDTTPPTHPDDRWKKEDAREVRVAFRKR